MYSKTQGLILREVDYKESDKILTVLTREFGKRTVKARGCRKAGGKLSAAAELLSFSEMTLLERNGFYTLSEAQVTEQFWAVRRDIELLALASYFAEVTEAVAEEGVAQPELLSLILNSLYALDKLKKPQRLVKAAFEFKLMCLAGYEPLVDACAVCGKEEPEQPALNLSDGVIHCAACRDGVSGGISMPLSAPALAALRHVVLGDPKRLFSFRLEEAHLAVLGNTAEAFLMTQLERGFRTLDFYNSLFVQASSPWEKGTEP